MQYNFVPMNEDYAKQMIENWKYGKELSIYDYVNEKDELLAKEDWGLNRFAVVNNKNELIGELTVSFFREVEKDSEDDGYTPVAEVKNNPDIPYEMWVGFGLRPDLTGKGLGYDFIVSCINFAVKFHSYRGEYARLGVAKFNRRAVKTYQKVGFEVFDTIDADFDGVTHEILWMKKRLY